MATQLASRTYVPTLRGWLFSHVLFRNSERSLAMHCGESFCDRPTNSKKETRIWLVFVNVLVVRFDLQ